MGAIFALYYYFEQLMTVPVHLWIFVPSSSIVALFMACSIYLNLRGRRFPLLDSLAFIGNFKYGLWTVFCLVYYFDIFYGSYSTMFYSFMLLTHLGMFLQSFIVFKWGNISWFPLTLSFIWFEINDIIDYTIGTHTELYTNHIYPAEVAAFTLTLTGFIVGISLIQKDQIISKICEVRGV